MTVHPVPRYDDHGYSENGRRIYRERKLFEAREALAFYKKAGGGIWNLPPSSRALLREHGEV